MKILFEVLLNAQDPKKSRFMWLCNKNNWLFIIEDGKRMRTLSVGPEPGKELQSTTLTESRACTSLSWNKDGTLLALVVDKRQIYFWEIKTNNFTHFKPINKVTNLTHAPMGKQNKVKEVELIEWSKVSNKLVVCYSTGQMLLCDCDANLSERFIDNSDGVLKRISSVESSKYADLFVCITIISELLVMTFNGESKFYIQSDDFTITKAKLSPIADSLVLEKQQDGGSRSGQQGFSSEQKFDRNFWLAYQTKDGRLLLKRISLQGYSLSETNSRVDLTYICQATDSQLVDFHWLSPVHLIACSSLGTIDLLHMNRTGQQARFTLATEQLLNINQEEELSSGFESKQIFKSFKLMASHSPSISTMDASYPGQAKLPNKNHHRHQSASNLTRSFSMATISSYKLFYYELVEIDNHRHMYSFEKVDDLNLTGSLNKLELQLERVKWCFDCSMLAIQLNNGHILVYRTRIQDYMVALNGSRAAYLSGANEITILNYRPQMTDSINNQLEQVSSSSSSATNRQQQLQDQKGVEFDKQELEGAQGEDKGREEEDGPIEDMAQQASTNNDNALVINIDLRPSIIAVGPRHLAVAMNNRILFYLVSWPKTNRPTLGGGGSLESSGGGGLLVDEQEYVSIVVAMSLSSRFVAVQFDDGRLKLHAIQSNKRLASEDEFRPTPDDLVVSKSSITAEVLQNDPLYDLSDERFFPDPTEQERITAFVLTDELLLYCTQQCNLNVFSLCDWAIVQACNHSKQFVGPILKLKANERGNKFICLTAAAATTNDEENVFMYDLYSNQIVRIVESDLYSRIFASQLTLNLSTNGPQLKLNDLIESNSDATHASATTSALTRKPLTASARPRLDRVVDAIWDGDGRTVLLVEQKCIHIFITLDHTLQCEDTIIWYVSTTNKASSYTILYASQGIVAFQTALGRVINSILESHDDELRLVRLEQQIAIMRGRIMRLRDKMGQVVGEDEDEDEDGQMTREAAGQDGSQQQHHKGKTDEASTQLLEEDEMQAEVMGLKLAYLKTIMPIYSLGKCKEICGHLMSEDVFQLVQVDDRDGSRRRGRGIDRVIWSQLAAWALFTMNLNFALLIYRKHGPLVSAHVLEEIIRDARNKRVDAKGSVKMRLLVLLGCCDII